MKKRDKPRCAITKLSDSSYLLKGTPDQDAIVDLVAGQEEPYILIRVEDGNIRDLSGSIITIPGGYLAFKRLFEANKRPAMYLTREIAQSLITAPKDSLDVRDDRVLIGGYEFTFPMGRSGFLPVGYISLADGKKILHLPASSETQEPQKQAEPLPAPAADESNAVPVQAAARIDTPAPVPTPDMAAPAPSESPNKVLSIINSIASDERNLALIKDAAYTAYAIITKVKSSGAASKEEVAACVVAALSAPETRSVLRRIGSGIFNRFTELNVEAGSVVEVKPGYRVTPDNEIILDEWPDAEMRTAIQSGMKTDMVKAHINYDHSLGHPEDLLVADGADFGYIVKDVLQLQNRSPGNLEVFTFLEKYKDTVVVNTKEMGDEFNVLILDKQVVFAVSSLQTPNPFGYYRDAEKHPPLFMKADGLVASPMPVCPDIYTVKNQYADGVIDALPNKVIQVMDPHKDDTRALVRKGYSVGTEMKGDRWVLWAFPAGKTLNTHGLPKAIAGGVPQY